MNSLSKSTVPAELPGPWITVCGPLMMVTLSKLCGDMYEVGGSMREGQPLPIWPPSTRIFSREPLMPRSIGSPFVPPLRMVAKPGMDFRKSAPSLAGTGWRGAFGSVTTVRGAVCIGAVTTMGVNDDGGGSSFATATGESTSASVAGRMRWRTRTEARAPRGCDETAVIP